MRTAILALSAAVMALALVQIVRGHAGAWAVLAGYSGLMLLALVVERPRYAPAADRTDAGWRFTGERFTDPTSGKVIEVFERSQTGERDYRQA